MTICTLKNSIGRAAHIAFALLLVSLGSQSALAHTNGLAPSFGQPARFPGARGSDGFMRAVNSRTSLLYVSDRTNSLIDVFDRSTGNVVGEIRSGLRAPVGLFVDSNHNLWVANGADNDILEFPRGATKPSERLKDPNQPNDVTMCPDGTLYVADAFGQGGVGVFPPGSQRATRRLEAEVSNAGGFEDFVTCDSNGNVFASGFVGASPGPGVTGWMGGTQSGYQFVTWNSSEDGIKATRKNTLLIVDGGNIVEYTEKGHATGVSIGTSSQWVDLALDKSNNVIFGAVPSLYVCQSLEFPSGTPISEYSTSNFADPEGVAIDPGG
jgi:hypothetical protein